MASSSSSATKQLLAGYLAGRVSAVQLVPAIAAEYYRSADRGQRERLRPVMEVIERVAPGVVRLARADRGAGFDLQPAERAFPEQYEAELRQAAAVVLAGSAGQGTVAGAVEEGEPGLWSRIVRKVRRLFSASA
ncbi:MAG: hypothetical protein ACREMF_08930 [Gemmatimonadales bacterium]